jgi:hypothetical protein
LRIPGGSRAGTVALYVAIVLAVVPAALAYIYVEPVTTMVIPVGAAMLPLLARTWEAAVALRIAGLSILGLFAVLGMASVGSMFLPAVVAMAVSVAQLGGARPGHRPPGT